ncbi:MAG: HAD family hydrolase [Candidatus Bathyarchaeia archaeon]
MFEAVIFDWDGTLADTREVILASFHQALQEVLGIDVSDDFIERRIGVGAAGTFREILRDKGVAFDSEVVKRLLEVKIQVEVDRTPEVRLFDGARELLELLQGKVKLALASMNNRAVINHMITFLGVGRFFSVVLSGDEVTKSKPDPEIFQQACSKLGSLPNCCAVIEDSIFGVKAAKAAKMGCVAVVTGAYTRRELERAKPDLVVESLIEKEVILKYILS